jgi:hypothetical protein
MAKVSRDEKIIGCVIAAVLAVLALWAVHKADVWHHDHILHGGDRDAVDAFDER